MKISGRNRSRRAGLPALLLIFLILLTILLILREFQPSKQPPAKTGRESGKPAPPVGDAHQPGKNDRIPGNGEKRIAIIIDDVGWNPGIIKETMLIQVPLTFAVLPESPFAEEIAKALSKSSKCQVFLHLPLESRGGASSKDPASLKISMDNILIRTKFNSYLDRFSPYITGVNNHMGSLFTTNQEKMDVVLNEIKGKNLVFIDSMTSPNSCGYMKAKKLGIKAGKRDIFLDNVNSVETIKDNLDAAARIAGEKGGAIAICHARSTTFQALREKLPDMKTAGYKFVFASQLAE